MKIKLQSLIFVALVTSCATSMTPEEFVDSFPKHTTTKFYNKPSATMAISTSECSLIVENRKYTAPIGMTVGGDVENGAIGVDEWVKADGGNAYTINNFEWLSVSIGKDYGTQLVIYFDTLLCN